MSLEQNPPSDLDWFLTCDNLDPFLLLALPRKIIEPAPLTTEEKKLKEELLANDSLGG